MPNPSWMFQGRNDAGQFTAGGGFLGALRATILLDTSGLDSGVLRADRAFMSLASSAKGLVGSLAGVGAGLTAVAAGAAAAAEFRQLVSVGAKFEYQMAKVGGVLRATEKEMAAVESAALVMGLKTEFSAQQAGEAMENLAKSGFTAQETISALPNVLEMATAASMDLGRSAAIAVGGLRGFQLPVQQLARVNDVLVGAANRTATSIEGLSETMTYAAPIANAMGYEIEDLIAMAGALGDRMVQGSMAGTQLAQAMQRAAEWANEQRMESSDLLSVLEAMNEQWASLTREQKALKIDEVFGERGGRAALILSGAVGQARTLQKELRNVSGESAELAQRMRGTTKGLADELASTREFLEIMVFKTIREGLADLIKDTNDWMMANENAIKSLGTVVSESIVAIGKLSSAIAQSIVQTGTAIDKLNAKMQGRERFIGREDLQELMDLIDMTRDKMVPQFAREVAMRQARRQIEQLPLEEQALFPRDVTGLPQFMADPAGMNIQASRIKPPEWMDEDKLREREEVIKRILALHEKIGGLKAPTMDALNEAKGREKIVAWLEKEADARARGAEATIKASDAEGMARSQALAELTGLYERLDELSKGTKKPAIDSELTREQLDAQVKAYEKVLDSDRATREEKLAIWDDYAKRRREQIAAETADVVAARGSAALVEATRSEGERALRARRREVETGLSSEDLEARHRESISVGLSQADIEAIDKTIAAVAKAQDLIDARKKLSLELEARDRQRSFDLLVANARSIEQLTEMREARVEEIKSASAERLAEIEYEIDALDDEMARRKQARWARVAESISAAYDAAFSVISAASAAWAAREERRQKNIAKIAGAAAQEALGAWLKSKAQQFAMEAKENILMAAKMGILGQWGAAAALTAQAGAWTLAAAGAAAAGHQFSAGAARSLSGPSGAQWDASGAMERDVDPEMSRRENTRVFGASYSTPIRDLQIYVSSTTNNGVAMYGTGHSETIRELFEKDLLDLIREAVADGAIAVDKAA